MEAPAPASLTLPREDDSRRARILAKTIYRDLRTNGLDEHAVLTLATELLGLVAEDMRSAS